MSVNKTHFATQLALVVWREDNTIHWINLYPLDSVIHPSNNKGRIEIFSMESKWSFISTTRAMDQLVFIDKFYN